MNIEFCDFDIKKLVFIFSPVQFLDNLKHKSGMEISGGPFALGKWFYDRANGLDPDLAIWWICRLVGS